MSASVDRNLPNEGTALDLDCPAQKTRKCRVTVGCCLVLLSSTEVSVVTDLLCHTIAPMPVQQRGASVDYFLVMSVVVDER